MTKKEMVIEEARKLFTEYGYKRVSMDEVAKKANVTKKTIYSYFKDKEELFRYFIEEELSNYRMSIEKYESSDIPFIELVSKNIYYILSNRKKSLLFQNIIKDNDENFLKLYDQDILTYLESLISNEMKKGTIKKCDPKLTAFVIYKIYLAVMFEYDQELDEVEVTKQITSILKDGLLN